MKVATYIYQGEESFGVVVDGGIIDIKPRFANKYESLLDVLKAGVVSEVDKLSKGQSPDFDTNDVTFLKPIQFPEKIFCVGVNYRNRNAEYKDGTEAPKYPSVFVRTPASLVGHRGEIVRPPESEQLDYEGEIAVVIGKSGRRIKKEEIKNHIAGFTIINEGTIRDWLRHAKFNVTQGKNFDSTGSVGPWMVTIDEFSNLNTLELETRVNGEIRQKDTTENMVFNFEYLLPYLSTFMELKPGDLIATGTPIGAGAYFDPPRWLVPGDMVEVEVGGIGVLSNTVVDEVL